MIFDEWSHTAAKIIEVVIVSDSLIRCGALKAA